MFVPYIEAYDLNKILLFLVYPCVLSFKCNSQVAKVQTKAKINNTFIIRMDFMTLIDRFNLKSINFLIKFDIKINFIKK